MPLEHLGSRVFPDMFSLAQAQLAGNGKGARELVAPCSACFLNLGKVDHALAEHPALRADIDQCLAAGGMRYDPGSVVVRHLRQRGDVADVAGGIADAFAINGAGLFIDQFLQQAGIAAAQRPQEP